MKTLTLGAHVFGGTQGESILLELPNGSWGIVDYYQVAEQRPIIRFLQNQHVEQLEFVCLTHPHLDHYKGMSALLEEFKIASFWKPPALNSKTLTNLVRLYAHRASNDPTGQAELEGEELALLTKKLLELSSRQDLEFRPRAGVENTLLLNWPDCELRITALAPSGGSLAKYENILVSAFDQNNQIREKPPKACHNLISMALLVEFGKANFILGGDVEQNEWKQILLDELSCVHGNKAFCLVKVSHHGSDNGYCTNLWEKFSQHQLPHTILTPYQRHRLPTKSAIEHIQKFSNGSRIGTPYIANAGSIPLSVFAPIESRLKMKEAFNANQVSRATRMGRFSIKFNNLGETIEMDHSPSGGWYT